MVTSITVDDDALSRFRSCKESENEKEPNAPNYSNEEFLHFLLDLYESQDGDSQIVREIRSEIDAIAFSGGLSEEEVDSIMNSLETVEERLGSLERQVEQLP